MNQIEHVIEPSRLWLAWQSPDGQGCSRSRRIVAEIVRENSKSVVFRYLENNADFQAARDDGFKGFPAFDIRAQEHRTGVLDAFVRRLPPRKREDFGDYLETHRLPKEFCASDMALLGYTGAKLPGDSFELVPDLTNAQPPFELLLEVAGFRYQKEISVKDLAVGSTVQLYPEPENIFDSQAIAIKYNDIGLGYVSKPYISAMHGWLQNAHVEALIERLNGKPERPLVYLLVTVRKNAPSGY